MGNFELTRQETKLSSIDDETAPGGLLKCGWNTELKGIKSLLGWMDGWMYYQKTRGKNNCADVKKSVLETRQPQLLIPKNLKMILFQFSWQIRRALLLGYIIMALHDLKNSISTDIYPRPVLAWKNQQFNWSLESRQEISSDCRYG